MEIVQATASDVEEAVGVLVAAFADDPITGYLLQSGSTYRSRATQFFSLLMQARVALEMPVLLARARTGIHGAAMGYSTERPSWPADLAQAWDRFESSIPGMSARMAVYDDIADKCKPSLSHYYLGVIGVAPQMHGRGVGRRLLKGFCELSVEDPLSNGVYLETAVPSNVPFYAAAGFATTGTGSLDARTLWCMYFRHASRQDA